MARIHYNSGCIVWLGVILIKCQYIIFEWKFGWGHIYGTIMKFSDNDDENKFCKLEKLVYSLKQDSCQWNIIFNDAVKKFGSLRILKTIVLRNTSIWWK